MGLPSICGVFESFGAKRFSTLDESEPLEGQVCFGALVDRSRWCHWRRSNKGLRATGVDTQARIDNRIVSCAPTQSRVGDLHIAFVGVVLFKPDIT